MRWPIRNQILVPFSLAMLLVLVGVTALNAWLAARRSAQQIEQQLSGLAQTLTKTRFPLTDAVLGQMQALSGAEFVLMDPHGKTLAASHNFANDLSAALPATDNPQKLHFDHGMLLDGKRYFQTAVSLNRPGLDESTAVLHILYPEQSWREAQWAAALPALAVGGIAVIAVALLAAIIAQRISRPIRDVQQQVSRLTEADFQEIPLPLRNDELRDLVVSVNRLAQQLDEMRQAIARGERLALLGQLSGGLAHHLRNDVTGAKMAVQLHQRGCSSGDRESLNVALRQLALTEDHLKRFLAAGKPQAIDAAPCQMADLVSQTVALVKPSLDHRKIQLQANVQPAPAIVGDAEQLRHLLMNLVLNAAEAAQPGGWVAIDVGADLPQWNFLRVRDSGSGPVDGIVDRLFEPFATDKAEGVGLGLSVARQIAEAHGGSLNYTRVDGATCFELKLPMAIAASSPDAPAFDS